MRARVWSTFAVLMMLGSNPAAAQIGDLLYPEKGINENIDHLEQTLQRLIAQIGSTVDASILKALQSTVAAVQSARMAYSDVLEETMKEVGDQRAALLYDLAGQLVELQKFADKQVNVFSEAEQRFNITITEATRAPKMPFVVGIEPQLYRPERVSPVRIVIRGQHLSDERNVLRVEGTDFKPVVIQPNQIEFNVDRTKLKTDERGFATVELVANRVDQSFWSFLPWRDDPPPVNYRLSVRRSAPTLGTYKVETSISKPGGYRSPDPIEWSLTNPDSSVRCVQRTDDEQFDPGYSRLEVTKNTVHTPNHKMYALDALEMNVPAKTVTGPSDAATITVNTPERLCVRFHSPERRVWAPFRTEPPIINSTSSVSTRLYYRVKKTTPDVTQWSVGGVINWDKDEPVQLPDGYSGYRATVNFTDAERDVARVFTTPKAYGPLSISFDHQSRTLIFSPNQAD